MSGVALIASMVLKRFSTATPLTVLEKTWAVAVLVLFMDVLLLCVNRFLPLRLRLAAVLGWRSTLPFDLAKVLRLDPIS